MSGRSTGRNHSSRANGPRPNGSPRASADPAPPPSIVDTAPPLGPQVVILDVAAPPLYWLILAASLAVLLRGHNEPGGGFIGGLMAATASILWAIAQSPPAAARRMPLGSPLTLGALGVLCGIAAGLPAFLDGNPFLTHLWGTLPLGFTDFPISTVLLFDVGVYLAVWGAIGGYALALIGIDDEHDDVPPRRRGR